MEIFMSFLLIAIYIGIFICMIIAAAMHAWFAFVGFFIAWLFSTIFGIYIYNS